MTKQEALVQLESSILDIEIAKTQTNPKTRLNSVRTKLEIIRGFILKTDF